MCSDPDWKELNEKFNRPFYDIGTNRIVYKYTVLVESNKRYLLIPEELMSKYYDACEMSYRGLSHLIRSNYHSKYIHLSNTPLTISVLNDTSSEMVSWLGTRTPGEKTLYHNPIGLWISCGSALLDWLGNCDNKWVKAPYVYELIIDESSVLRISNMFQFRKFIKKYRNKDPDGLHDIVNWVQVKADYNGLIICPYLGERIWKRKNPDMFGIDLKTVEYIETALDEKVFEIDDFIFEWYRHWETATGVIWNPKAIKEINLIGENHWYENFMNDLRNTLVPQNPVSAKKTNALHSELTILSYNVSWQSTSGRQETWKLCNNSTDPSASMYYGKCINNIAKFVDHNGPYNFVCMQETTNLDTIINQSKILSEMFYEKHKSGPEEIVTFWNSDYHLVRVVNGEFEVGRPFQILIYKENICLINLHMPHVKKHVMKKNLTKIVDNIPKLTNYRYIIAGDFNYEINHPNPKIGFAPKISVQQIDFFIDPTRIKTCCVPPLENHELHFDHVIDSYATPVSITSPVVDYPASDHNPIIVKLVSNLDTQNRIYQTKYIKYKKKYINLKNAM